jgi:hypothetical protein
MSLCFGLARGEGGIGRRGYITGDSAVRAGGVFRVAFVSWWLASAVRQKLTFKRASVTSGSGLGRAAVVG